MDQPQWLGSSLPFLNYLDAWYRDLPSRPLAEIVPAPERAAIVSVDVINGFCHEGPLASPRVKGIIEPIVGLFQRAWGLGVRHILLTQDTHEPDAVEFAQYPPHCVRGTSEAEPVPEFQALPFFGQMTIFEKNSIHSGLNTGLNDWIADHPQVDTYIVVGDCTDLCTYQLAMHLRLDANARQLQRRVVVPEDCVDTYDMPVETARELGAVPEDCVDTYDMPVETARELGAVPHDAELLHRVFLYSMMLNGIEVVASLT